MDSGTAKLTKLYMYVSLLHSKGQGYEIAHLIAGAKGPKGSAPCCTYSVSAVKLSAQSTLISDVEAVSFSDLDLLLLLLLLGMCSLWLLC